MSFLTGGQGVATLLLAHGAGAPMDHPVMEALAQALMAQNLRVIRFEFAYMAQRREGGPRRPPPKIYLLCDEFRRAVDDLACAGPLFIGGKSMGGRVASMVADDLARTGQVQGALCYGYPFHPQGKPDRLRTAHLMDIAAPVLICHGTRDPFGSPEEIAGYGLPPQVQLHWLDDGDHDFKPRKRVTGQEQGDLLAEAAQASARWIAAQL
ncbi:alpha/beta family hydrolase [Sagittula sp. SSi028]|uniref:alpha/beta family hydrolase n=1 Tax=Sagittula sp. SSi028 TaxID=3400636 RepID=UPI003AF57076